MRDRSPLPLPDEHWRSRWLVLPASWNRLHRVSEIEWDDAEDMIGGHGVTLCGRKGFLTMPGFFSRMGLTRCAHCCRLAGVPMGDGAPFNQHIAEYPMLYVNEGRADEQDSQHPARLHGVDQAPRHSVVPRQR